MARVFVSSTYADLKECRVKVRDALRRMDHEDVAMEYFAAESQRPVDKCLQDVDSCDLYVGMFALRYGHVPKEHKKSITELEYRKAVQAGKDCIILLLKEGAVWPTDRIEFGAYEKIKAFRDELMQNHVVAEFTGEHDIEARLTEAIYLWQKKQGAPEYIDGGAVAALHQLPRPPGDFTGRKAELEELMGKIQEGGVAISGVQGMGGVGKTALALKLAEGLTERYPDAQFYLDLKGTTTEPVAVTQAMAHVVRGFEPAAQLPEDEAELRGLYLSKLHGKQALLLMDNALNREQVEPLVPPSGCVLLVTSRQRFTLPGLFVQDLDTLPPEDARDLLLAIAPRIDEQAEAIAELCGYLPLALRLAGTALAERVDLSPEEYTGRLRDSQKRLELVDASLSLSYDLLRRELQKLWRALAVFPETFDVPSAAAVWELEGDAAKEALSELVGYSLVEWNEANRRHRLHDLTRVFADSRLGEAEREDAQRRHAEHYRLVLAGADDLYLEGGESLMEGLRLFDLEQGNIQAGQAWAAAHADEDDDAARLCSGYCNAGVYVLNLRQHPRQWIEWLDSALTSARRLKDRKAEGLHLGNLGGAYFVLGETRRAIEHYEQRLAIAREIGDRRGEGSALGNLGLAYADLSETRRAIEYHEQSLAIKREIGDRRGEGNSLGNLGLAYADLGEPRRAIELYEQHLAIAREIGDRRGEGNALWNMALALDELGERDQAIANAEAALEILEQIEDPNAGKVRAALAEWREGEKKGKRGKARRK